MATANIYDLADTWNDGLTTFTAIKMDVTDTASASDSLLMDLKVGASSKFSVDKEGNVYFRGHKLYSDATAIVLTNSSATPTLVSRPDFTIIPTASSLRWGNLSSFNTDLFLTRKGPANLQLGAADAAGPAAQTLSVQSVVAGTSNTAGEDFTIQGSAGTGSAAGGSIVFQLTGVGSGTPPDDEAQNSFYDAFKITQGSAAGRTSLVLPAYSTISPENGRLGIDVTGNIRVYFEGGITVYGNGRIGFSSEVGSTGFSSATDTAFFRDGPGQMALRDGANAQEFRVYKTTTGTVYKALLGDNNLIKISGEAFTDGAGASTGTLTNAPAAGNPTKWIPIDDNGTTRYIPAW
jgi:hypothetical protein